MQCNLLRKEDFNSFATRWQIRWSRGRIYVTSYKWLRWSKALQGCPKPPPHSSDALPLTSGLLSILSTFSFCVCSVFLPLYSSVSSPLCLSLDKYVSLESGIRLFFLLCLFSGWILPLRTRISRMAIFLSADIEVVVIVRPFGVTIVFHCPPHTSSDIHSEKKKHCLTFNIFLCSNLAI